MLTIRDTLMWYKRLDVRQAMVGGATKKEIGVRHVTKQDDGSFKEWYAKRPDALEYEQEILESVQRGATSFHASEELWSNPRAIETGMNKERTNELRVGWDLILDVDFTNFEATKLITHALIQELKEHGLTTVTVKFSGNKGFHIGIPWEAMPSTFDGKPTATLFPEAARAIADYLVEQIDGPHNHFALSEAIVRLMPANEVQQHIKYVCGGCGNDRKEKKYNKYFVCPKCQHREVVSYESDDHLVCPKCKSFMELVRSEEEKSTACEVCKSEEVRKAIDLKIDTQLVSSRHLYRLEYSLHEKSGLVSLPIPVEHVLTFKREQAKAEHIKELPAFWNRAANEEGFKLFIAAQLYLATQIQERYPAKEIVWEGDAAPEEVFPPTIKKMLVGMHDGKKRALFILTNFLRSSGWNYDMIDQRLREWNKKNDPPLREQELVGHVRYHKQRGVTVLPPNFENDVYKDLGVLVHDELSVNTKNPVQYVKMKLKQQGKVVEKKKDQ
jgi:hypothetical protein